jgi:UDP-2,3-diacylglucosamine pyrophosphatase LpxH
LHLTGDHRRSPDEHDRSISFSRFIEDLTTQLDGSSRIRLVVVGDMLDLTRVEPQLPHGTAVDASIRRLDQIALAHARLFGTLGLFVSAGGHLDMVIGNHDLDLAHRDIQQRFVDCLGLSLVGTEPSRVRFHNWFLYERGVVYAEHGHRFHDINAVRVPDGRDVPSVHTPADVPLAAFLDAFGSALRAGGSPGRRAMDFGTLTGALIARMAAQGAPPADGITQAPGSSLRAAALPDLDDDAIVAIEALSARIGVDTAVRVANTIIGPPMRLLAGGAIGSIFRGRALARAGISLAVVGALATFVRERRSLWPPPRSTAYAVEGAKQLQRVMETAGSAVPFYVLGHTHVPSLLALDLRGKRATYLNTGSWLGSAGGKGYPFVRITQTGTSDPHGQLLWWRPETSL